MIWVDLAKLDFAPGAPVMMLNPDDVSLSGEVSGRFKKSATTPF